MTSIFEGLSPDSIRTAFAAAKSSPVALGAVLIVCAAMIAAIAFAAGRIGRHLGGFAARVREEDETMREELDKLARQKEEERGGEDAPQKGT